VIHGRFHTAGLIRHIKLLDRHYILLINLRKCGKLSHRIAAEEARSNESLFLGCDRIEDQLSLMKLPFLRKERTGKNDRA